MDYRSAGVDIDKADNLTARVSKLARKTLSKNVISSIGGFASLYELPVGYSNPVLVSSTDGVGTKVKLARQMEIYSGLGFDLVAMNVDDLVCTGAEPLFFLDYYACGHLNERIYISVMESISEGCKVAGVSLVGGETAEMPGVYEGDEFDLAGFVVGVVEKEKIINGSNVNEGDVAVGMASSGFHSNGYSLVRKVLEVKKLNLLSNYGMSKTLGELLLEPTVIYSPAVLETIKKFKVNAIAHITGGGLSANVERVLPEGLAVKWFWNWGVPEVMDFIIREGRIDPEEARRVFNMGVGMVLIVDSGIADDVVRFLNQMGHRSFVAGEVVKE